MPADHTEVAGMASSKKAEISYRETETIVSAGQAAVGLNPGVQNAKSHALG